MTKRKLRKNADISPPKSPHDGIHTCSKGCKKPGCNRTLRDTIEEQYQQIEALKRDVLEQATAVRQLRFERIHDISHMGGQDQEISRLQELCENHAQEAKTLAQFMSRFDWILYAHNCKGGASETHAKLDALRDEYLEWKNPEEGKAL
jgi:uncharacterized metal-binding protein